MPFFSVILAILIGSAGLLSATLTAPSFAAASLAATLLSGAGASGFAPSFGACAPLRLLDDVGDVELAFLVQDQARVEVGEGYFTDVDGHRLQLEVDATKVQRLRFQEIGTVRFVHHHKITEREIALVARLQAGVIELRGRLALVRHLTARWQRDVEELAQIRLDRHERDGLRLDPDRHIEREDLQAAIDIPGCPSC